MRAEGIGVDSSRPEAPQPWEERPVPLSELSGHLTAIGCGKQAHLAPLIEITQGPDGTTIVAVASVGNAGEEPSGAIEVRDPFAVSDTERSVEVNGRFLRDALREHSNADLKGMSSADLSLGESGMVHVGDVEVRGVDGMTTAQLAAMGELGNLRKQAIANGVTIEKTKARLIQQDIESCNLTDEDAFVAFYLEQAEWPTGFHERWEKMQAYEAKYGEQVPRNPSNGWGNRIDLIEVGIYRSLAEEYDTQDRDIPYEEWLEEKARSTFKNYLHEIDRRYNAPSDYYGSAYQNRAEHFHEQEMREWAINEGHDYDAVQATSESPKSMSKYHQGILDGQRVDLRKAKWMLEQTEEVDWEPRATVQGFGDEVSRVLSASAPESVGRPILSSVYFSEAGGGRPRMVSTDSYRLHTSTVSVPQRLASERMLMNNRDLDSWQKNISRHIDPKDPPTQLGIAVSDERDEHGRAVVGIHSGQMRVASRSVHGDFPTYESLMPEDGSDVVVNSAELLAVEQIAKGTKNKTPVRLRFQHGSGGADRLGWFVRDQDNPDESPRGSVPTLAPLPVSQGDEYGFNPGYLGDSLRFASASGKGGAAVEMRRIDKLKPMLIVPEGSPPDWRKADRAALVMPVRLR